MQRVRVGVIGLAAVLLLIGLAATVFSVVSRERPVTVAGAPQADVAANLAVTNTAQPSDGASGEPLAELGVAPSGGATPAAAATPQRR